MDSLNDDDGVMMIEPTETNAIYILIIYIDVHAMNDVQLSRDFSHGNDDVQLIN